MGDPISAVVPTRDRPTFLEPCLLHLRAALREGDELIVADSASTDPGVREVAERFGAVYVRCDEPGASIARNAGWRAASHPIVAFVDDDIRVEPGWADGVAGAFAAEEDLGFITGRIGVPAGQEDVPRPVAVTEDAEPRVLDASSRGSLGHSASLAVRREALERIRGFDPLLGAGARFRAAEDYDLFDRLFAAGYGGRFEPRAAATHEQWRGKRQMLKLDWSYGIGTGARIAKLLRTDRRRARRIAADFVWRFSLRPALSELWKGHEFEAATRVLRVCGTFLGFLWALPVPVRDGRFSRRGVRGH